MFTKTLIASSLIALAAFGTAKADTNAVKADLHGIVVVESTKGIGTGIILKGSNILTNSHVIHNIPKLWIKTYEGREYPAHVVFDDVLFDVAEIQPDDIAKFQNENSIHEMKFATTYSEMDKVYSIANPLNIDFTISQGHIMKALHRYQNQDTYSDFRVVSDVKNLPGASGGALVNESGDLIGMNKDTAPDRENQGSIGMSIPIEIIEKVLDDEVQYNANALLKVGFGLDEFSVVKDVGNANGLMKGDKLISGTDSAGQLHPFETNDDIYFFLMTCKVSANIPLTVIRFGKLMTVQLQTGYVRAANSKTPLEVQNAPRS